MFTIEQVKAAHSKVKSGADFPSYVKDLIALGVISYDAYVTDGHVDYMGKDKYATSSSPRYEALHIEGVCNLPQFTSDLKAHQQGKTDYMTFCKDCAKSGVEKWTVSMEKMTCTYFDRAGNSLLTEIIPSV